MKQMKRWVVGLPDWVRWVVLAVLGLAWLAYLIRAVDAALTNRFVDVSGWWEAAIGIFGLPLLAYELVFVLPGKLKEALSKPNEETKPRVPFMAEPPPDHFVERPREYERLIAHLLDPEHMVPVAITAALRGAGGYGKTTLAQAICHDERVREAFKDGILWVTLGEAGNVLIGLTKLYAVLTGKRPTFVDVEDAASALAEEWGNRQCLVVIDDVWNSVHLLPFLRGDKQCARLITTRNSSTLPPGTKQVDVDAMRQDEAVALLRAGFSDDTIEPFRETHFRQLAARLGEWPLLLKLVNGVLRRRVHHYHQALPDALGYIYDALDKRGLTAFDARKAIERNQAVSKTVGISLGLLNKAERMRYSELVIFPEDTAIPLETVAKLWNVTGGLDYLDTEELCEQLFHLSLLLRFDLADQYIRLHDVMRSYLAQEQKARLQNIHGQFLDAYSVYRWADLSPDEPYLRLHLAYHLKGAGRHSELRDLLLNWEWLQKKLNATDVTALLSDYDLAEASSDASLGLVQGAIRLSAHVLAQDKMQLRSQLYGRLLSCKIPEIQAMMDLVKQWRGAPWLCPLVPSLIQAGGPLLRTLAGHSPWIWAMAITSDGRRAVSGLWNHTLKVWDLTSGEQIRTLVGHTQRVGTVAVPSVLI